MHNMTVFVANKEASDWQAGRSMLSCITTCKCMHSQSGVRFCTFVWHQATKGVGVQVCAPVCNLPFNASTRSFRTEIRT